MATQHAASKMPRNFHHPYQPYDIQVDFMNAVYDCIEQKKVGILESPTGTGKSLSLICGAATWLRDFQRSRFDAEIEGGLDDGQREPDWLLAGVRNQRQQDVRRQRKARQARLDKLRLNEERARARYESGEPAHKRLKVATDIPGSLEADDSEFLLDDYESEAEKAASSVQGSILSAETQALLEKLGVPKNSSKGEGELEQQDETKIFYCSRTHSQLSQFAAELRRVLLPVPLETEEFDSSENEIAEALKHVTLGSRKQLCINPKVSRLGHVGAINERCLELQQPGVSTKSKCPYIPSKENEVLVNDFRDHALAKVRDIEDLGELGKKIGICPYYATRATIKPSEIVTVPYPLLLQKSAREALGISLKGHVVIIDEAHNLMDSISNVHSVSVNLAQLQQSREQLATYLQNFHKKLKGKNRVYVTQLVRVIDSLTEFMRSRNVGASLNESEVQIGDLLLGKGLDQINLYKLMAYLQESKLARKVERYLVHKAQSHVSSSSKPSLSSSQLYMTNSTPVLNHIHSFLLALTNPAAEGRFFLSKNEDNVEVRYILLDPTHHFREIVSEARAVILAGGTMSPMSDFTNHLFHYLPTEAIHTLSCGHIIPPSSLLAQTVSNGPNGVEYDFTFGRRNSEAMINELGLAIVQLSASVPSGLVVFFPSHAYLNKAVELWQKDRENEHGSRIRSIWTQLSERKKIFQEPKSGTSSQNIYSKGSQDSGKSQGTLRSGQNEEKPSLVTAIDKLLSDYTSYVLDESNSGALLFAVIGGSLSEGINFSDKLGRGIVVVGLPFPNAQSAEWRAKLEFVEKRSRPHSGNVTTASHQRNASKEYYENACMRAVNQSIGRAIRHKGDYAAIFLLDKRYERDNIRSKLPAWIQRSLQTNKARFQNIELDVTNFFRARGDAIPSIAS